MTPKDTVHVFRFSDRVFIALKTNLQVLGMFICIHAYISPEFSFIGVLKQDSVSFMFETTYLNPRS